MINPVESCIAPMSKIQRDFNAKELKEVGLNLFSHEIYKF